MDKEVNSNRQTNSQTNRSYNSQTNQDINIASNKSISNINNPLTRDNISINTVTRENIAINSGVNRDLVSLSPNKQINPNQKLMYGSDLYIWSKHIEKNYKH